MEKIALEYLRLNGVNDPTAVVTTCESEPGLCPSGEERKLVHVVASTSVATTFISVLGFSTIDLTAEAVSEAASLDVILVLDTSESMTFDEDKANAAMHGGLDFRDPQICNADDPTGADGFPGECHPFEEGKADHFPSDSPDNPPSNMQGNGPGSSPGSSPNSPPGSPPSS